MTTEKRITRDLLRKSVLGVPFIAQSKLVELDDEVVIEVKSPTPYMKLKILLKSRDEKGLLDIAENMIHSIISCCFVPGTDTPIFEETDIQGLREAGHVLEKIAAAVNDSMTFSPEDAKKN